MNKNNEINLNPKSLAELPGLDYYYLVEKFSIVCSSDIEKMMDYFAEYFNFSKRSYVQSLPVAMAAQTIMEVLRNHCVPLRVLHECLSECGLCDISDWLGQKYPADVGARPNLDTSKNLVNFNSVLESSRSHQLPGDYYTSTKNTLALFEEILPVIHEKSTESHSVNVASPKRADKTKLFGCFQLSYIDERKLTFRKRQFSEAISFIKELKMIRNRHLNLYTGECILKCGTSGEYFLLYSYEPVETQLLRDYAQICHHAQPNQFNTLQQLEILRDISCGLSFLHSRTESKKNPLIHSNLSPDTILIETRGNNQVSAKIFDFVHSVEMNDVDNFESKLRDEFYKFGQIILMVASWRFVDRIECDRLHFEESDDEEVYIYELFRRFDMDKQPNNFTIHKLLKMFYKLTAPDYDLTKGIDKSYQLIKQQIQQLIGRKTMWP